MTFRGSSSFENWIANLKVLQTSSYTSFPDCGCQVHKGFYSAEQKVIGGVLTKEVKRLQSLPMLSTNYTIKTTGHRLGAALAQLTAMIKNNESVVY